jgi:hypothetical protein
MGWIARLITLALAGALADALVASLHGTPLALGSVAGGLLLAIVGLGLFWSRPWIGTTFGLLALAGAFAAGGFGDVRGGPSLTGLSSSDAGAVVFTLVLLAGAIAAFLALANVTLRVVVVGLFGFGLVTTAASIGAGGLAAAFVSAPLAATRGAYIAVEILAPLAAVIALVWAFALVAKRRGAKGAAALVLALALVAGTQLGASSAGKAGLPTITAFEGAGPAFSGSSGTYASGNSAAGTTGPLFVPKGSGDVAPEVVAFAKSATDPNAAVAAVAALGDDLYPGALGGPVGALRSGSANSIDKALLLRDTIRAGSPNVQTAFAACTLAPDAADALIAQARAPRPHPKLFVQAADSALAKASDPKARALLQRLAQTWKTLVTQAQSEGQKLAASLASAGLTLPPSPGNDRLRALAADHVWVRVLVNGNWVDLDPTIEPAAPGKTRCASATQTATLPDDRFDVLGVRVVSESQASGGALQRTVMLDRTIRTADIGDRDVSVMFAEPTGMDTASGSASPAPPGATAFTPLVRVGEESLTGTALALPVPAAGSGQSMGKSLGSAIAGAFGTPAPTPLATTAPAALPTVTGVWIDLAVSAPGSEGASVESPIFDRIGVAARAAQSQASPPPNQPAAADYRAMQTIWNVAVSAGRVVGGSGPATVVRGPSAAAISGALARLNGSSFGVRRAIVDDAHGTNVGLAATRPGISIVAMDNAGALLSDIASDSALPLTTDEARPVWAAASVLAERQSIDGSSKSAPTDTDALVAYDRATASGSSLVAFHPGDAVQQAAIPADARVRIANHLSGGASLLAPSTDTGLGGGPPYAFWIIDPATGTLRDENVFGRHQELGEEAETDEAAIKTTSKWKSLACRIAVGIMIAVTDDSSAAEGKTFEDSQAAVEAAEDEEESEAAGCGS